MKKMATLLWCIALLLTFSNHAVAQDCITIQDGLIYYSAGHYLEGEPLMTGFDPYGYNYGAHLFSGSYFNVYSGGAGFPPYEGDAEAYLAQHPGAENHWAWPYRDFDLVMKWNDAWLSNKDCDGDGKLDRHLGYSSYIGSGAWETNHTKLLYFDDVIGKKCKYVDFVKIVAVPDNATKVDGVWYSDAGVEIGADIWGQFAIIQEVVNDPCYGVHGLQYSSPDHSGFGGW